MTLIERAFREKIVVVGVAFPWSSVATVEDELDELALLVDTAGADVVARVVQRRERPDPATDLGKGKVGELAELSNAVDADTVVFDEELAPAQQRNLEKLLGRTAIDRTAVILDIFAQNARSREGRAQVELALLRYRLPRLRGKGHSMMQQAGRIGTRGPGETKLEEDRRRLVARMGKLEGELREVAATRRVQRRARGRSHRRAVSLVGYTNAGKSTTLNALTDADVLVGDQLFSTLDPRTRRLSLPGGETVFLSDTVGFVRKLPHQLVEAFRSTLEVVREADLVVHIVDASGPDPEARIAAVREVLVAIGAAEVPELMAFNKADLADRRDARRLEELFAGSVVMSAASGSGLEDLVRGISRMLHSEDTIRTLLVPFDRGDVLAAVHREGEVLEERETERGILVVAVLDDSVLPMFAGLAVGIDGRRQGTEKRVDVARRGDAGW